MKSLSIIFDPARIREIWMDDKEYTRRGPARGLYIIQEFKGADLAAEYEARGIADMLELIDSLKDGQA